MFIQASSKRNGMQNNTVKCSFKRQENEHENISQPTLFIACVLFFVVHFYFDSAKRLWTSFLFMTSFVCACVFVCVCDKRQNGIKWQRFPFECFTSYLHVFIPIKMIKTSRKQPNNTVGVKRIYRLKRKQQQRQQQLNNQWISPFLCLTSSRSHSSSLYLFVYFASFTTGWENKVERERVHQLRSLRIKMKNFRPNNYLTILMLISIYYWTEWHLHSNESVLTHKHTNIYRRNAFFFPFQTFWYESTWIGMEKLSIK